MGGGGCLMKGLQDLGNKKEIEVEMEQEVTSLVSDDWRREITLRKSGLVKGSPG